MRTCVAIMCVGATCLTQAVLRAEPVAQTARSVPVVRDADVVVVGGGSAAVAAAVAGAVLVLTASAMRATPDSAVPTATRVCLWAGSGVRMM